MIALETKSYKPQGNLSKQRLLYVRSTVLTAKACKLSSEHTVSALEYLNQSNDLAERHCRKCMENRIKQLELWSLDVWKECHAFTEINPKSWLAWIFLPRCCFPWEIVTFMESKAIASLWHSGVPFYFLDLVVIFGWLTPQKCRNHSIFHIWMNWFMKIPALWANTCVHTHAQSSGLQIITSFCIMLE